MNIEISPSANFVSLFERTLRCSRFAQRALESDSSLLDWLKDNYSTAFTRAEMQATLQQLGPCDEEVLARSMRRLRKQVIVKLILRDLNGLADLNEVMFTMSSLAEVCLQSAQRCVMRALVKLSGNPIGETSGIVQEMLVIGMGKLGGKELNVSSDIDLIFIYPEDGQTDGNFSLSNHEFFSRLGRRLINMINEFTADGFVFRVDVRLRPYGDSGPLVMSFAALEEYLISQGREWERYAWVKARVIDPADNPPSRYTAELEQLVQPFVYRKYLDFGAIDSMRKLHAQIRQEVQRRDRLNNIKLGPGGIREIEFIAQVFQLIRGGSDVRLRIRPTRSVLQQLGESAQLPKSVVIALDDAYVFLRNLEHRLQYLDDQQTQELPDKKEDQETIASAMGYVDFAAMNKVLDRHRALVSQQFELIFGSLPPEPNDAQIWLEGISAEELNLHLNKLGYHNPQDSGNFLLQFRDSNRYRQLPELSRQRLDRLIPQFVSLCAQQDEPDTTLSRLLNLLEGVCQRASYLAFLAEYPLAMQRLTRLVAASSWASEYLTQHPALLDELLDSREIYLPPQWSQIDQELQTRLDDSAEDAERQLDVLRHVQQEQTFHLLSMDLQGMLPLETLSDHLSDLADLILRHVLRLSWTTVRKRHRDEPKFAVISYGKLGGKELGYASDLDLIFLYDDDYPDAQENYARLAQRINTMLGSYTSSGRLYEIDLRLRPNGASGLLVSSIEAFAEYQQHQAWVWEHQALTRARFSAGDEIIGAKFEQVRRKVLCQPRELAKLRDEILAMRKKMRDGHPNNSGLFDIKHDIGGMVDIEFMVQYIVLAYAHQYQQLTSNIGNLALLKLAAELKLIPADIADQTGEIYRTLRQTQHRMRLNNVSPCRIDYGAIDTAPCRNLWKRLFGDIRGRNGAEFA
jgi:glutamate-ammonia-ligase adenylyltransferase